MKTVGKIGLIVCALLVVMLAVAGCGKAEKSDEKATDDEDVISEAEKDDSDNGDQKSGKEDFVYEEPGTLFQLDLTKEDPSTDEVDFNFNDNGSINSCCYHLDGSLIKISYLYDEGTVAIYAFSDDIVAAHETFAVGTFDATKGFVLHEGYFFKGYTFS